MPSQTYGGSLWPGVLEIFGKGTLGGERERGAKVDITFLAFFLTAMDFS